MAPIGGVGAPARQLRVEPVMGTTISIDVREPFVTQTVIEDVVAWFHDVDARFSMYREASETRRIAAGELHLDDASPDVRAMFTLAERLRERTGGYFDIRAHRPDGLADPSGVVKGWSVDEAVTMLRAAGARNLQLAAGGDLVAVGEPEPGRPWRIGIRHPDLPRDTAAQLDIIDLAVATSGLYERGAHIRDPLTGVVPSELRSVTVIGPELAIADAYATAAFAMGERGLPWIARQRGFGAVGITRAERVVWTPMAVALRTRPDGG